MGAATGANANIGFESRMLEHTTHRVALTSEQFRGTSKELPPLFISIDYGFDYLVFIVFLLRFFVVLMLLNFRIISTVVTNNLIFTGQVSLGLSSLMLLSPVCPNAR